MNNNIPNNKKNQANTSDCYAFCPACGTDLYYRDNECICKNKECSWSCKACQKPGQPA
jgi:hypothetical protein